MAFVVPNIAKGRAIQLALNVNDGTPATSRLVLVPINSTDADDALRDADTLAALLALANTAECSGTGWERKVVDGAGVTVTLNDSTNTHVFTVASQTWTGVASGADNATHIAFCYDSDNGAGTDADLVPLGIDDTFVVNTDGSDITYNPATAVVSFD